MKDYFVHPSVLVAILLPANALAAGDSVGTRDEKSFEGDVRKIQE